jgi:MSHA biogenesis protein MshJ
VGSAAAVPGTPASAPGLSDPALATLYRHGVELQLEGSYADLLDYLKTLEAMPQRVLWGGISLKVEQHPKAVLTLRLYTISRDRHWLEI